MQIHKFKINNPCGPCEWHISSGIRIFAIFDLVFQSVFIIPVILQFKIFHTNEHAYKDDSLTMCRADKAQLAIIYSTADLLNLSMGMASDIFMYIGAKQNNVQIGKLCTWLFIGISVFRQAMHATAMALHIVRCMPVMYPYEIVVRLLCQYLLYGFWIAVEYLLWLRKGCHFVPRRGLMEPPVEEVVVGDSSAVVTSALSGDSQFLNISAIASTETDMMIQKVEDQPVKVDEKAREMKPARRSRKHIKKEEKKVGKGAGEADPEDPEDP